MSSETTPAFGAKVADIETKGTMKRTRLPDATREEMLTQNGLPSSAHWSGTEKYGHGPDDTAEQQDGERFTHPNKDGYTPEDDDSTAERVLGEIGFVLEGGWTPVSIKGGAREGGITSHRGVIHPDEYVDDDRFMALVEQHLGFTYEEVRSVYTAKGGRPSKNTRGLRERIDARLLALSRSGGNLVELGRRLGFYVDEDRRVCEVFERALARARVAEGDTADGS